MDIASYGASGAVVVVVGLFLRYMAEESKKRDISHDKMITAIDNLTNKTNVQIEVSQKVADSSDQMIQFMTKLNGSLKGAVRDHKR